MSPYASILTRSPRYQYFQNNSKLQPGEITTVGHEAQQDGIHFFLSYCSFLFSVGLNGNGVYGRQTSLMATSSPAPWSSCPLQPLLLECGLELNSDELNYPEENGQHSWKCGEEEMKSPHDPQTWPISLWLSMTFATSGLPSHSPPTSNPQPSGGVSGVISPLVL